ncbi:hypothetical protein GCM10027275_10740 [Rhabdobacter roseus]
MKAVSFHGKSTYPLYVQLTHARKTRFFKSSAFELFSHPRFAQASNPKDSPPTLAFVIEREIALLRYVVKQCQDAFSLDRFKKAYSFYGMDLCVATEVAFRTYLQEFLDTKGAPNFGKALAHENPPFVLFDLLREAERVMAPSLYAELTTHLSQAPPYLELHAFTRHVKPWPDLVLTNLEWEQQDTQASFVRYVQQNHPGKEAVRVVEQLEWWLDQHKKSLRS